MCEWMACLDGGKSLNERVSLNFGGEGGGGGWTDDSCAEQLW